MSDERVFWYRYVDSHVVGYDYDYEVITSRSVRVTLHTYLVDRETPKGVWLWTGEINARRNGYRWVSKSSHRRFAWATEAEALVSFQARKRRQIQHLVLQLKQAQAALDMGGEGQVSLAGWTDTLRVKVDAS